MRALNKWMGVSRQVVANLKQSIPQKQMIGHHSTVVLTTSLSGFACVLIFIDFCFVFIFSYALYAHIFICTVQAWKTRRNTDAGLTPWCIREFSPRVNFHCRLLQCLYGIPLPLYLLSGPCDCFSFLWFLPVTLPLAVIPFLLPTDYYQKLSK